MKSVLNVLLTHQAPPAVARMLAWWQSLVGESNLLLVHGGLQKDFDQIAFTQRVFVNDPRLRTRHHQRDLQSYTTVFQTAAEWLKERKFSHVYFAEYDHLPLIPDLNAKQLALLELEDADVLGHQLRRVDRTNQPHYLYHSSNPDFAAYWQRLTRREDARVVLSMFGSGSFWTREAFLAVAAMNEPFPMYLEIRLPTLAHHLGFRVRNFGDQNPYVLGLGDFENQIAAAQEAGAWTVHPVKKFWKS